MMGLAIAAPMPENDIAKPMANPLFLANQFPKMIGVGMVKTKQPATPRIRPETHHCHTAVYIDMANTAPMHNV